MRRLAVVLLIAATVTACAPVVVPPGAPVAPPALADDAIIAADGARLPLRAWRPADEEGIKAVLIALHGFNDYGNFFDTPGTWFRARGIASYAYDQRGFGENDRPGFWAGLEALRSDLATAVRLVRARHPGKPVYLLGASMGAAVVMVTVTGENPPPVDGVVLSAPAVWGREAMPFYQRLALAVSAHTFPWATVTGEGLGILASDNIEMLRALGRDPLVIKKTRIDAIHGLVGLMDAALAAAAGLEVPALILYGAKDEVIPENAIGLMLDRLPPAPAGGRRIAYYPEGWHMLMRDLQAETVWRDIAHWIGNGDAPLPSGADSGIDKALRAD